LIPRILLLGASGQVGWELARSLQPLGQLVAWTRVDADLSQPDVLVARVMALAPDVIVNAAAYTAVDRAESERALAFAVNAAAPAALASTARALGALFVHYSTDYVFDGSGSLPRNEQAACAPLNVYGESKLAGEAGIAAAGGDWLVLRTSWVYAARGENFLTTMLRLGASRSRLAVVADQIGAPTSARLLADSTAQILARALVARLARTEAGTAPGAPAEAGPGAEVRADAGFRSEVLHVCAAGQTSRHGFAQAILAGWRARHGSASLSVCQVDAIASHDHPGAARRPLNSRLDCTRLASRYGLRLPDWREGLVLSLAEASRPEGS